MKRILNKATALAIVAALAMTALPTQAYAAASSTKELPSSALLRLGGTAARTPGYYGGFGYSASPDSSYLYTDALQHLNIVTVNENKKKFTVSSYDPGTLKKLFSKTLNYKGYEHWGGFYAAPDGYLYVVVGRDNPKENDSVNVIEVRKYGANWSLVSVGHLKGGAEQSFKGIYIPFRAGRVDMAMVGGTLIAHTSRQMYIHDDGLRHQSNMTFEVDTNTMTVTTVGTKYNRNPYVSHSFNQFVRYDGEDVITVDHGDAYPRAIRVNIAENYATGDVNFRRYNVFNFIGKTGDNYTGATVTGLEIVGGSAFITGSSVPQDYAVGGVTGNSEKYEHNIYLIKADINAIPALDYTSSGYMIPDILPSTFSWVTTMSPKGKTEALEPRLVKLNGDRFALLYSTVKGYEDHGYSRASKTTFWYRVFDASGTQLAVKNWNSVYFDATSDPVVIGNTLYWTGSGERKPWISDGDDKLYLYALDISNPLAPAFRSGKKSSNSYLKKLSGRAQWKMYYTSAKLHKKFKKNRYTYRQTLRANTPYSLITFKPASTRAEVKVKTSKGKWKRATSDTITTKVPKGKTKVVRIQVTSQNGKTKHTYKITIKRPKK